MSAPRLTSPTSCSLGRAVRCWRRWEARITHLLLPGDWVRGAKVLAAMAAGSWLLSTDYLAACTKHHALLEEVRPEPAQGPQHSHPLQSSQIRLRLVAGGLRDRGQPQEHCEPGVAPALAAAPDAAWPGSLPGPQGSAPWPTATA